MNASKKKSKDAKWTDWLLRNLKCKRKMTKTELIVKKWRPLTKD